MRLTRSQSLVILGATLVYLWLMATLKIGIHVDAAHDDALYAKLAMSLLRGDWLGGYDSLTLLRGSFYSIWLAANSILGAPLFVSQGLLYLGAGLALLGAVAPKFEGCWGPWGRWLLVAAFVVFLFNPAQYASAELRVIRAGLYTPLTILVLALVVWWFRLRDLSWRYRLPVAAGLGLTLGCLWITREEGVWILPVLATALIFLAARRRPLWRRMIALEAGYVVVAAMAAMAPTQIVATINDVTYGVDDVVEFRQPEFLGAYGALARINHTEWRRRIVAPREARARAYAVSPAFRELKPFLDGARGAGWAETSCRNSKPDPCVGEIGAGWFVYALRQAAAFAGHHQSATKARAFYARMAAEINAACEDGRLACSAARRSMAPPFRVHYVHDAAIRMWDAVKFMVTLDSISVAARHSTGAQVDIDLVSELVNMRPFPRERALIFRGDVTSNGAPITAVLMEGAAKGWRRLELDHQNITVPGSTKHRVRFDLRTTCLQPDCNLVIMGAQGVLARVGLMELTERIERGGVTIRLTKVLSPKTFRPAADRTNRAISILGGIAAAYAVALPYATIIALGLFAVSAIEAIWRRRLGLLVLVNTIFLAAIAARLGLLSYVDVAAFPAINTLYLSPIYPILMLFCVFALADGLRLALVLKRRHSQK
jgi:hypothetical protein